MLKGLARCLTASAHQPLDLACRIGDEEFALLVLDTDRAGVLRVTEEIHARASALAVSRVGVGTVDVKVSVGANFYEAKTATRNRTRRAPDGPRPTPPGHAFRATGI